MCTGVANSDRLHLEVPGAGHYGIFSGSRWRSVVYPQVLKFIQSRQPQAKVKTVVSAPAAPVKAKAPVKVATQAASVSAPASVKKAAPVKAKAAKSVAAKPAAVVKTTWVAPKKKA
jgi:poly(3-hydroxybutyrate) depolymerase